MGTELIIASAISTAGGMMASKSAAKAAARAGKAGQRSYLGETMNALDVQEKIYDRLPGLERQYQPIMQELQRDTLMGQMGTLDTLYQESIGRGAVLGSSMLNSYAPVLAQAAEAGRRHYYNTMGSSATIADQLESQALQGLYDGRNLSAAERVQAEQSARAAMGARGFTGGNQAVAQEVLNTYNMGNEREKMRRQNAMEAVSLRNQMNANAYNMYGAPLVNLVNQTSPSAYLGLATQMNASLGPQLFQPESQYNADVMGSNANVNVQSALAAAQAKAGMAQGLMSLGGTIAGSAIQAKGMENAAMYKGMFGG